MFGIWRQKQLVFAFERKKTLHKIVHTSYPYLIMLIANQVFMFFIWWQKQQVFVLGKKELRVKWYPHLIHNWYCRDIRPAESSCRFRRDWCWSDDNSGCHSPWTTEIHQFLVFYKKYLSIYFYEDFGTLLS